LTNPSRANALWGALQRRPKLRRILVNAAWLSWDQFFRLAVSFVAGLWVARYLGVERWGALTYSLALVGFSIPLITLGLDGIMVRDLVLGRERASEIVGTGFIIKAIGAAAAGLLALLLVMLLRPTSRESWLMVGILSFGMMFTPLDVIEYWYRSRVESRYAVLAKNVGVAASGAAKIGLVVLGGSLVAFAGATALEYVTIACGFVLIYHLTGQRVLVWRVRWGIAKEFLAEGWPLALAAVALSLLLQANEVLLGQLSSAREVGLYSAARRLSELWFFVPLAVSTSVGPSLVAFRTEDPRLYREKMLQLFRAMIAFAAVVAIGATLLAGPVVSLVYGEDFRDAAAPLRAYIWVLPSFAFFVVQYPWDINEGLTIQRLTRTSLGVVLLVLLDLALIPSMGASGAALSAAIAFAVAGFLGNLTSTRTREVFRLQILSLTPRGAKHLGHAFDLPGNGKDGAEKE
jgi:PST family polysaccharide transporter